MLTKTVSDDKTVHMNAITHNAASAIQTLDDRHNGWTNYETWRVWFDLFSNPPFYQFWLGTAHDQIKRNTERTGRDGHDITTLEGLRLARHELARELETTYEQLISPRTESVRPELARDMALAALALVNWPEIAAWLIRKAIPELEKHFAKVTVQPKAVNVPVRVIRLPDRAKSVLT